MPKQGPGWIAKRAKARKKGLQRVRTVVDHLFEKPSKSYHIQGHIDSKEELQRLARDAMYRMDVNYVDHVVDLEAALNALPDKFKFDEAQCSEWINAICSK